MSSGFVSGGTSDQPRERNELWHKAEQELEAARQRKLEQKNHDGKSLYEVLQENKAAKQEAFEEASKLKHQFRSLDEDDVTFLNSVRDSETAKERAVQQETLDQLDTFRKLQQEAESAAVDDNATMTIDSDSKPADDGNSWQVSRKKRKRDNANPVKGLQGVKAAKTSAEQSIAKGKAVEASQQLTKDSSEARSSHTNSTKNAGSATVMRQQSTPQVRKSVSPTQGEVSAKPLAKPAVSALGLGGYSSEDD